MFIDDDFTIWDGDFNDKGLAFKEAGKAISSEKKDNATNQNLYTNNILLVFDLQTRLLRGQRPVKRPMSSFPAFLAA